MSSSEIVDASDGTSFASSSFLRALSLQLQNNVYHLNAIAEKPAENTPSRTPQSQTPVGQKYEKKIAKMLFNRTYRSSGTTASVAATATGSN
jgi:hypothetical protein